MNGNALSLRDRDGSNGLYDVGMRSHSGTVHYAPGKGKCLMHRGMNYSCLMETPNERLRKARIGAGYSTADEAADAMGVNRNTYRQHENDTRNLGGIPRKRAEQYAKKFKVTLEWLLTGNGPQQAPVTAEIHDLLAAMSARTQRRALRLLKAIRDDEDGQDQADAAT